jgi:hypothetical protein
MIRMRGEAKMSQDLCAISPVSDLIAAAMCAERSRRGVLKVPDRLADPPPYARQESCRAMRTIARR